MTCSGQQLNSENNKADNKDEETDAVYAMHVTNPFAFWTIRVLFFQVEIFGYLAPDAHGVKVRKGKIAFKILCSLRSSQPNNVRP